MTLGYLPGQSSAANIHRFFSAGFVAEPRKPRNIRVVAVQLALVHIVPWIFNMGL